jgi:hypothetical protein
MPANDNTKSTISSLSPELEMRIAAFNQNIAKALCANLNRNVLAESQREVQLSAQGVSRNDDEK